MNSYRAGPRNQPNQQLAGLWKDQGPTRPHNLLVVRPGFLAVAAIAAKIKLTIRQPVVILPGHVNSSDPRPARCRRGCPREARLHCRGELGSGPSSFDEIG